MADLMFVWLTPEPFDEDTMTTTIHLTPTPEQLSVAQARFDIDYERFDDGSFNLVFHDIGEFNEFELWAEEVGLDWEMV